MTIKKIAVSWNLASRVVLHFMRLLICAQLNEDGKTKSALIAISNIDELKQSEIELKKSEEKYRCLFENSTDGIYISTPEGRYIDANTALVDMLGYGSREELLDVDIPSKVYVSETGEART